MGRAKGIFLSYITLFLEVASGLLFTPFLIRMFGQAEYGVYGLVLTITSYMSLMDMGVGNSIVRYMAKFRVNQEHEQQRRLLGVTIIFYSIVAGIVLITGGFISSNIGHFFSKGLTEVELERAKIMLFITICNSTLSMWLFSFNKTIIAFERFAISQVLLIIRIVAKIVILIPLLLIGGKGISVVTIDSILTLIMGAFSVFYVINKLGLKPAFKGINSDFVKEIVGYTTFIFLQMVATQVNAMVNQILIAAFVPLSATILAIYGLGSQISSYIQRIAAAINGVLMPGVVKMVEKKSTPDEIEKEMVEVGRLIFIILAIIWINLLCFGKTFMTIYGGKEYVDSYWVIILISFPMVLSLPQSIGTQILWAIDKHKVQALLKIGIAVVNIILTTLLINWNPLIGASIGTCLALFFGDVVVMNIVFSRDIKINVLRYYKSLIKGTILAIIVSLGVGALLKIVETGRFINFAINCIIVTCTYLAVMLVTGFTDYEKGLIKRLIFRFRRAE